jgi:hypothetical protein
VGGDLVQDAASTEAVHLDEVEILMAKKDWTEANEEHPCPICSKPDWCLIAKDGSAVICHRVESAKLLSSCAGYLHRLIEPTTRGDRRNYSATRPWPRSARAPAKKPAPKVTVLRVGDLPDDWREFYDERAAIMEHDGRLARDQAEQQALAETLAAMRRAGEEPMAGRT